MVLKAPSQCAALTKAGKRCCNTSANEWRDAYGNAVSEPLRFGLPYCRLHLPLFCTRQACTDDPLVFMLDFETSGLSIMEHHIVEIGLLNDLSSAVFSTVVCPPVLIEGPAVHGISNDELLAGPMFGEAIQRMLSFVEGSCESLLEDNFDSSDDEAAQPILKDGRVQAVICAQNGAAMTDDDASLSFLISIGMMPLSMG